jgi:chemotaxis signal transduction protein
MKTTNGTTNGPSKLHVSWEALKQRTKANTSHELTPEELSAIFASRAEALARAGRVGREETGARLLAFVHGSMSFAVEPGVVLRVLSSRKLTRIPGAPRHLDRVIYDGGRVVSVLHPVALFGEGGTQPDDSETVLLLECEGRRLGVRATRVVGPRQVDLGRLGPPSTALEPTIARCVKGIAEDLTVVLDGAALIGALRQG